MRLDEIEAKASKAVGRMDNEIALLIRAVRQQQRRLTALETFADGLDWEYINEAFPLDPDVLALLEEE
jgi:hypothetical protein